jgi:hypothetical protein
MWWVLYEKLDTVSVSGTLNQRPSNIYWTKMMLILEEIRESPTSILMFVHDRIDLPPQQKGSEPLLYLASLTDRTAEVNRITSSKAKERPSLKL